MEQEKSNFNRKTPPSHYEIFKYWKTKIITPNYNIVDYLEKPNVDGIKIVIDEGEPSCWCCSKPINQLEKNKSCTQSLYNTTNRNKKNIWNNKSVKSHLNRCHIIPKGLGGNYDVDNLFLMCPKCHAETPDVIYPKIFFAWFCKLRRECLLGKNIVEYKEVLQQYCDLFNIQSEDVMKYVATVKMSELTNKCNDHKGYFLICSEVGAVVGMYLKYKNNIRKFKKAKGEQIKFNL